MHLQTSISVIGIPKLRFTLVHQSVGGKQQKEQSHLSSGWGIVREEGGWEILQYNFHSTAENHYRIYPDSNWRSFGTLEETAPGLLEPLHYHFRYADLMLASVSERIIYCDKLSTVGLDERGRSEWVSEGVKG